MGAELCHYLVHAHLAQFSRINRNVALPRIEVRLERLILLSGNFCLVGSGSQWTALPGLTFRASYFKTRVRSVLAFEFPLIRRPQILEHENKQINPVWN